jgi:hemerythrin
MEWNEDFDTGLPDIDVQHRYIFTLIQRIYYLDNHADQSAIRQVVIILEHLTRCHFDCEELLMATYDYPESVKHVADHSKLLVELQGYQDKAVFSARKLALVLSNWLTSHSMLRDRQLAVHVLRLRNSADAMTAAAHVESQGYAAIDATNSTAWRAWENATRAYRDAVANALPDTALRSI